MYNDYFHFTEPPFSIAPDPQFIYMSARHQEGLAHLLYGIAQGGGFVVLTGEVGTGKTTLCRCLLQQLPGDIDIALILNPKLNAVELLAAICDELRVGYEQQPLSLKHLVDVLNRHLLKVHGEGRRTVVLIDEAQNLSLEVLEQIRLLTNLETSKTKLLQIILVGQPELRELLGRQELRQLNQRITARYHLLPLSRAESETYIRHRLSVASGYPDLFSPGALSKIYQLSAGIPRLINIICERALLGAFALNSQTVTQAIAAKAAREALAPASPARARRMLWLPALAALALLVYAVAPDRLKTLRRQPAASGAAVPAKPADTAPETAKPSAAPARPGFDEWLAQSALTLPEAVGALLKAWGKNSPAARPADCAAVQGEGLNCLFGKAAWPELKALDRPAVLEFNGEDGRKRYAAVTGVNDKKAQVRLSGGEKFPLADVLAAWNGYYLMLWRSPQPGLNMIGQGRFSDSVAWVRRQLDSVDGGAGPAGNPGYFDPALKRRVSAFQTRRNLTADGVVGAQTFIHLDNLTGAADSIHLQTTD